MTLAPVQQSSVPEGSLHWPIHPPKALLQETQAQLLTHELATLQKEATLREEQQHTIQERITAITHTPPQMDPYTRQKATQELQTLRKELKLVIVIAAMRKLLPIIYGVFKTKTPFNANIQTI